MSLTPALPPLQPKALKDINYGWREQILLKFSKPFWGKAQHIAWEDIAAMQIYPLLPQTDQEVERRLLQGRKKYRAAEGHMLLVPRLPLRYRMAGLFVGVGGKPIVAFTNRAHSDYETLLQRVQGHIEAKTDVR